jgi:hypothetical protein
MYTESCDINLYDGGSTCSILKHHYWTANEEQHYVVQSYIHNTLMSKKVENFCCN